MPTSSSLDGVLVQWGDRLFYPSNRVVHARTPKLSAAGIQERAHAIRRRIHATVVRRAPQVMVKVTGGGRGMAAIPAHLRYISKGGRLPIEDDRGFEREGKEALRDLVEQWRLGGSRIPEISERREAFNMMLSMHAGTKAEILQSAAREFAKAELANHRYAMVLHTHQANPHVHLSVRAEGRDGQRLNPRKEDLRRWRETFAERLRGWGIEAEATSQVTRGNAASQRAGLGAQDSGPARGALRKGRGVAEWHQEANPAGLGRDHACARGVAGRVGSPARSVHRPLPGTHASGSGHRPGPSPAARATRYEPIAADDAISAAQRAGDRAVGRTDERCPRRRTGSGAGRPRAACPSPRAWVRSAPRQGSACAGLRPPLTRLAAREPVIERASTGRDSLHRSRSDQRQATARGPRCTGGGKAPLATCR